MLLTASLTASPLAQSNLAVLNGKLYFQANDGTTGSELWASDGTAGGTTLVKDIYPGADGNKPNSGEPVRTRLRACRSQAAPCAAFAHSVGAPVRASR